MRERDERRGSLLSPEREREREKQSDVHVYDTRMDGGNRSGPRARSSFPFFSLRDRASMSGCD